MLHLAACLLTPHAFWPAGLLLLPPLSLPLYTAAPLPFRSLQLVAVFGSFHLGQLQIGLSRAARLGQGREVTITSHTPLPMQVPTTGLLLGCLPVAVWGCRFYYFWPGAHQRSRFRQPSCMVINLRLPCPATRMPPHLPPL